MSHKIAGIGEVLWDLLPSGPQLGGAPANVACHARALGAESSMITRVGNDRFGRDARARLQDLGVGTAGIQTDTSAPTGTVTVELSQGGQPLYTIHENVAWDRIKVDAVALELIGGADAVCFGTLAQRSEPSRSSIQQLVSETRPDALRIFDINLRQNDYTADCIERSLRIANALKLNDEELPVLAEMFQLQGSDQTRIERLAQRFELNLVALTRGANGSLLFLDGQWSNCGGREVSVKDTVGAGDSFTAVLALGKLNGLDIDEINERADEIARYVCSCEGATPALPDNLRGKFSRAG